MKNIIKNGNQPVRETKLFSFELLVVFIFAIYAPHSKASDASTSPPQNGQESIHVSAGTIISGQENIISTSNDVRIYVAEGATISGDLSNSNIKIIQLSENSSSIKNVIANSNNKIKTEQFVAPQKVADGALKKLQEKVAEKIKSTMYTCRDLQESILLSNGKLISGAVSSTSSFSSNFENSVILADGAIYAYAPQRKKQRFYTTFENLQVFNVNTSFLRGPPLQMV